MLRGKNYGSIQLSQTEVYTAPGSNMVDPRHPRVGLKEGFICSYCKHGKHHQCYSRKCSCREGSCLEGRVD